MDSKSHDPSRLRGVLKLLMPHCDNKALVPYPYDECRLLESQALLQARRKRRLLSNPTTEAETSLANSQVRLSPDSTSFVELVQRHRFVSFFVIQEGPLYYSKHVLALRKRLALNYNDCMTVFVVNLNYDRQTETGSDGQDIFSQNDNLWSHFGRGTGFTSLPTSSVLMTLLNITQVPTLVVIDTSTGRPISSDAVLALEWNDPHDVLQAWHTGYSGLNCWQKLLALATFQSDDCTIL